MCNFIKGWLAARCVELRAREEAKANAEAVAEAEYFEEQTEIGETARQELEQIDAEEKARAARGDD